MQNKKFWRQFKKSNRDISIEDLENYLDGIFKNIAKSSPCKIALTQYCKTEDRLITRTERNLKLCTDPTCNCATFTKVIDEHFTATINKDPRFTYRALVRVVGFKEGEYIAFDRDWISEGDILKIEYFTGGATKIKITGIIEDEEEFKYEYVLINGTTFIKEKLIGATVEKIFIDEK